MSKIGIIVASANNNQKLAIELQKIAIELNYEWNYKFSWLQSTSL